MQRKTARARAKPEEPRSETRTAGEPRASQTTGESRSEARTAGESRSEARTAREPDQKPEQPENPETQNRNQEANKGKCSDTRNRNKEEGTSPKLEIQLYFQLQEPGLTSLGVVTYSHLRKRK